MNRARLSLVLGLLLAVVPFSCTRAADGGDRLVITEHPGMRIQLPGDPPVKVRTLVEVPGNTPAKRMFIARLWNEHARNFPAGHREMMVPDGAFIEIDWQHNGKSMQMISCHPFYEPNNAVVVTVHGIEPLNGRSRADVIKAQPEWWQRFRASFDAIVSEAENFREPSK